ncbi:hypothetical protein [Deinococcus sp. Leaf326]|uniref:hypothetical protein n=1 Tax=Deinococcus sp. Leaf326 TaxID=1736338 RepID=UPI0006FEA156|nr:hypothetical protein [Deinococcus sp. Leaf326]KQR40787.1 hypothetical protein ASF71_01055 [Deinococcus sp. Leaf326]
MSALPPIGTGISHKEHGSGTVKAVLPDFEKTGAVVMINARDEYLARPDAFVLAGEAPAPASQLGPLFGGAR